MTPKEQPPTEYIELADINIIIKHHNNRPAIELRKVYTDTKIIQTIVSAAYHQKPVIILPRFNNTLQALNKLQEKGIIYRKLNEKTNQNEYYFL